jgi:anti-anti-sigma factor
MHPTTNTHFDGYLSHQHDQAVVVCSGEIDMASAAAFRALLDQAVETAPTIVIDMHDVTFLDSTGLRMFVTTALRVQNSGSVTIRNAPDNVTRVLHITGIDTTLKLESTT